jgi:hypothetical protein
MARSDRFARTRPYSASMSRYHVIEVLRALRQDNRHRALWPLAKQALEWAITERMNSGGAWWSSWRDWSQGVDCDKDSLRKALLPAFKADLFIDPVVTRTPYARPPERRKEPNLLQGSNIYRLDPLLIPAKVREAAQRGVGRTAQGVEGRIGGSSSPPKNVLKGTRPIENEAELLRSERRFTLSDGEEQPSNYVETLMALRDLVAWLPDADEYTFSTFVDHFGGVDAWDIRLLHEFMVGRELRAAQGKADPIGNYSGYARESLRKLVDGRYGVARDRHSTHPAS